MQNTEELVRQLDELERSLYVFHHLSALVELDANTAAPHDTTVGRSAVMEYLSREQYTAFASEKTGELLRELSERKAELSPRDARRVEFLKRDYDHMKAIPQDEYVAYDVLVSEAQNVWVKAKQENDFASFAPYLEKIVASQLRFIEYRDPEHKKKPYEVLLDDYEYGLTEEFLDNFFAEIKKTIVPLVHQITERGRQPRDYFLHQEEPIEKQRELSDYLMDVLTIDRNHCAITETEHPFTLEFNKDDVRITTHYHLNEVMSSFYSVMHEGGHALYELHTGDDLRFTALASGASSSIHESISRFFENIIGRSRGFCDFILPKMKELFPEQFKDVVPYEFYKAVNIAQPSLIRTEADELTYCLHIMLRYEIEKGLINREIEVKDLPQIWNAKMKEYLGIDVPNDSKGVLQDTHWSGGMFGYFPTYALGNAYGAQMCERMKQDVDVAACCAKGDLKPIVDWLTEHVFQYGCLMDPIPLFEQYCGAKFTPSYYCNYLKEKYSEIYAL